MAHGNGTYFPNVGETNSSVRASATFDMARAVVRMQPYCQLGLLSIESTMAPRLDDGLFLWAFLICSSHICWLYICPGRVLFFTRGHGGTPPIDTRCHGGQSCDGGSDVSTSVSLCLYFSAPADRWGRYFRDPARNSTFLFFLMASRVIENASPFRADWASSWWPLSGCPELNHLSGSHLRGTWCLQTKALLNTCRCRTFEGTGEP